MSPDLILLAISLFFWGLGEGMFLYLQPLYLQELGADPLKIGAILGAYGAVMALSYIPAGYLADRFGRRPLLWAGWVQGALAAWIMALAPDLRIFVIGLFMYAMTTFVIAPLNSYVTAARGRLQVGPAMLGVSTAYSMGQIFGPFLGGRFGQEYGLRAIYYVSASLFLVSLLVILFIHRQPVEKTEIGHSKLTFIREKGFIPYSGLVFIVIAACYLPQPFTQNYLHNQIGVSIETVGLLASLVGVGVVVLNLLLSRLDTRLGFLLCQLCVASYALLLWQGSTLAWYGMAYFLIGGYRSMRTLIDALASYLIPMTNIGLAFGILETIGALAIMIASLIAGVIYAHNPILVYPLSIIAIVVALLLSVRFAPKSKAHPVSEPIPRS